MLRVKREMRGTEKLVVFPSGTEYHMTKEVSFAYHSGAHGKVKGVMLNSLCGAYIGSIPYQDEAYAEQESLPRLYDKPPPGFVLCQTCERSTTKPRRLVRLLSHFFQDRRDLSFQHRPVK